MAKQTAKKEEAKLEMTNEELKKNLTALAMRNRELESMLQRNNLNELTARLTFLFKVVENKDMFPEDYVQNVVEDIMYIMPKADHSEPEKEEE